MASISEIFWTFLRLGFIAFGGPVAHLGYFRRWFIDERGWLDDAQYAQIIALCHLLPGPSSSQTGFAIGLHRAGLFGALAAFIGFTLPAAIIMIGLGIGLTHWGVIDQTGWIQGLKLAAIAVVANAIYGMARTLCPDMRRASIAIIAALGASLLPGIAGQMAMIAIGAVIGLRFLSASATPTEALKSPLTRAQGGLVLGLFALALIVSGIANITEDSLWAVLYQSGALVFGGGHVVLPLLETGLVAPGLIDNDRFLAGYGAAQAIPGPIFSFAGYLGAQIFPNHALSAGLIALIVIFSPGMLLVAGLMPFWQTLSQYQPAQQALAGINATVVGLIAAVLWNPLLTVGIQSLIDALIALGALVALMRFRIPVYWVVAACAIGNELLIRFV
ncbi:MAG: chromate efflux transporter [Spiribacter sp.]|nr:chromate efflux transporter [Spiribacter sp.]MDR9490173.1 chromate efflux transporter [Spiribacter sp.]